jgi:hypothetical protein
VGPRPRRVLTYARRSGGTGNDAHDLRSKRGGDVAGGYPLVGPVHSVPGTGVVR